MYKDLPLTGVSTFTILGVVLDSTILYFLVGISFILVAFRLLRLIYKEKKI